MDQENKTGETSKKGLYIIIGIIVILVILWFAKGAFTRSITGGNVDRNLDGSTTYSNNDGTVTVGGNKLPDNWPSDAPKYPNASIQYSGSSNPQTGEEGSAIVFTTSDTLQNVVDFYKKELASSGWKIEQTANVGSSTVISAAKDTRTLGVYISDAGNGQVSVTVGIGMSKSQ
jgi:hypothetical protein